MNRVTVFRLSQLLLIFPCALREWINCLTDIGQYERVIKLAMQIMTYPTQENTDTLFNQAIHSVTIAKCVAVVWILAHGFAAAVMTYGMFVLMKHLKAPSNCFNQNKIFCFVGLSFILFFYVFMLGFAVMDYFLSWMQQINFNGDITGYGLPLMSALLYLTIKDSILSS